MPISDHLKMLLDQRNEMVANLNSLLSQLANDKAFNGVSKTKLKKAIRTLRKEIHDIDQLIAKGERTDRQSDRNDMREHGFDKGIDTRSNQIGKVGEAISNLGQSFFGSKIIGSSAITRKGGSMTLPNGTSVQVNGGIAGSGNSGGVLLILAILGFLFLRK